MQRSAVQSAAGAAAAGDSMSECSWAVTREPELACCRRSRWCCCWRLARAAWCRQRSTPSTRHGCRAARRAAALLLGSLQRTGRIEPRGATRRRAHGETSASVPRRRCSAPAAPPSIPLRPCGAFCSESLPVNELAEAARSARRAGDRRWCCGVCGVMRDTELTEKLMGLVRAPSGVRRACYTWQWLSNAQQHPASPPR